MFWHLIRMGTWFGHGYMVWSRDTSIEGLPASVYAGTWPGSPILPLEVRRNWNLAETTWASPNRNVVSDFVRDCGLVSDGFSSLPTPQGYCGDSFSTPAYVSRRYRSLDDEAPERHDQNGYIREGSEEKSLDILQDLRSAAHPNVAVDPE